MRSSFPFSFESFLRGRGDPHCIALRITIRINQQEQILPVLLAGKCTYTVYSVIQYLKKYYGIAFSSSGAVRGTLTSRIRSLHNRVTSWSAEVNSKHVFTPKEHQVTNNDLILFDCKEISLKDNMTPTYDSQALKRSVKEEYEKTLIVRFIVW